MEEGVEHHWKAAGELAVEDWMLEDKQILNTLTNKTANKQNKQILKALQHSGCRFSRLSGG